MHVRVERDARTRTPAHNERGRLGFSASAFTHAHSEGTGVRGQNVRSFSPSGQFFKPSSARHAGPPGEISRKEACVHISRQAACNQVSRQAARGQVARQGTCG